MYWMVRGLQQARAEFVLIAREADVNKSETCQRFGISRKTGYKRLDRYKTSGLDGPVVLGSRGGWVRVEERPPQALSVRRKPAARQPSP